jgi:hypothetical protein
VGQKVTHVVEQVSNVMLLSNLAKSNSTKETNVDTEIQRDNRKGKAVMGLPVQEIMSGPKLMVDAQKFFVKNKVADMGDITLMASDEDRVQGLSSIEITNSGEEDFISDEAQGNQPIYGVGNEVQQIGLVRCVLKDVEIGNAQEDVNKMGLTKKFNHYQSVNMPPKGIMVDLQRKDSDESTMNAEEGLTERQKLPNTRYSERLQG